MVKWWFSTLWRDDTSYRRPENTTLWREWTYRLTSSLEKKQSLRSKQSFQESISVTPSHVKTPKKMETTISLYLIICLNSVSSVCLALSAITSSMIAVTPRVLPPISWEKAEMTLLMWCCIVCQRSLVSPQYIVESRVPLFPGYRGISGDISFLTVSSGFVGCMSPQYSYTARYGRPNFVARRYTRSRVHNFPLFF